GDAQRLPVSSRHVLSPPEAAREPWSKGSFGAADNAGDATQQIDLFDQPACAAVPPGYRRKYAVEISSRERLHLRPRYAGGPGERHDVRRGASQFAVQGAPKPGREA